MKIEITHGGVDGHKPGDVVDIEGDAMPAWAVNKARVFTVNPKADEPQTTPRVGRPKKAE